MKMAVGSDEKTEITDFVLDYLKEKGHTPILFGALAKPKALWTEVARNAAETVKSGEAEEGIIMCWTGTGVAMAANKVPGIRAVTVTDAETTIGARKWDHANVLCFSCFLEKEKVRAVLDAWFHTPPSNEPEDLEAIKELAELERAYFKASPEAEEA